MDKLRSMEAFTRVVQAGSYSAAAREWGRSKAALSKYVSELESELGFQLLRRSTRALSLTDAGASYYRQCCALLEEIERIEGGLRDEHRAPRGLLRISAAPGFMSRYGSELTHGFCQRYPEVELDLHLTHRMVDLVDEGFDLAIRVSVRRPSNLISTKLCEAPLILVAAPSYVRERGTPRAAKELSAHDCLIDTNMRDHMRWRLRDEGRTVVVPVRGPLRANSPALVRDLAIEGHGIAMVPRFMADQALDRGELVELLAGQVARQWVVHAVYLERRYMAGRVRAFIDYLVEQLR